jgi:hypothetical protein
MIKRSALTLLPLALLASACSDAEETTVIEDPSKLSAELEERAQEIEERAAIAVREAEALAEQELQQLRAEANADGADDAEAAPQEADK